VKRLSSVSFVVGLGSASLIGLAAQSYNQALIFRKYVVMDQVGFHTSFSANSGREF
jgi:hypothetical protein